MSQHDDTATNPALAAAEPMMEWWQKQWSQGVAPMARMQLVWMQSMAEAMQFEAQFLQTLAESGQQIAQAFEGAPPQNPAEMQQRYQALLSDLTDAQMDRMKKAAELSHDFRRRIWEEI